MGKGRQTPDPHPPAPRQSPQPQFREAGSFPVLTMFHPSSCWPGKQAVAGPAGGGGTWTLTRAAWTCSWGKPAAQLAAASLLTHMCIYS